jgi:hypothetical protein
MAYPNQHQWEPNPPKPKIVPSTEPTKISLSSTGELVRAKIIADLTAEYIAHLDLVIKALKRGDKEKAVDYETWAKALHQAIQIASK